MPGYNGNLLVIRRAAVALAGIKQKSLKINREPVDVTVDESLGWISLLGRPGTRQVEIGFTAVVTTTNEAYFNSVVAGLTTLDATVTVLMPNAQVLACAEGFFFGSGSFSAAADGAVEFEGTLSSSGPVTLT
jgi:predicted secreted protein